MTDSQQASPFILTGMHRSGTSLAASLLQAAGISIGERLVPADVGNVKGHFEDRDFLDLHMEILQYHRLNTVGWTTQNPVPIPPHLAEKARQLITQKSAAHPDSLWGWKDPRTTHFLDFWQALLPNARFIFLFRSPWEVFDSLARRGSDPELLQSPARILELWAFYNRHLLRFIAQHPAQSLLISNDTLASDPSSLLSAINQKFNLSLPTHNAQIFDPTLMRLESAASWHAVAVNAFDPQILPLYDQLQQKAALPSQSILFPKTSEAKKAIAESFLSEWLLHRATEIQLGKIKTAADAAARRALHLEQMLSPQQIHAANLKHLRITTLEQSLAALQIHSRNLEQALLIQQTHSANLEKMIATQKAHAANLEQILATLKTHAENLEKLANYQPVPSATEPA